MGQNASTIDCPRWPHATRGWLDPSTPGLSGLIVDINFSMILQGDARPTLQHLFFNEN